MGLFLVQECARDPDLSDIFRYVTKDRERERERERERGGGCSPDSRQSTKQDRLYSYNGF